MRSRSTGSIRVHTHRHTNIRIGRCGPCSTRRKGLGSRRSLCVTSISTTVAFIFSFCLESGEGGRDSSIPFLALTVMCMCVLCTICKWRLRPPERVHLPRDNSGQLLPFPQFCDGVIFLVCSCRLCECAVRSLSLSLRALVFLVLLSFSRDGDWPWFETVLLLFL